MPAAPQTQPTQTRPPHPCHGSFGRRALRAPGTTRRGAGDDERAAYAAALAKFVGDTLRWETSLLQSIAQNKTFALDLSPKEDPLSAWSSDEDTVGVVCERPVEEAPPEGDAW